MTAGPAASSRWRRVAVVLAAAAAATGSVAACSGGADDDPAGRSGVRGTVVVDAGDAVLVVPRGRAQDVRAVVDALKARKLEKYL